MWRVGAGAVLCAAALATAGSDAPPAPPPSGGACTLTHPGPVAATSEECRRCHRTWGAGNHPVDVDYRAAEARSAGDLRTPDEVVRRGVLLPEGRIQCVTCHDARSPWKDHLALPPGAEASLAVDPRDPATYERQAPRAPRPGAAVGPKPLCIACHALGD